MLTVRSLTFDGPTVRSDQLTRHHTQRTETLCEDITLDITIVVLASPNEATLALNGLGNHVVNETMLVVNASSLELRLVGALVDVLEDILEATIVFLHDSVLGGHELRLEIRKSRMSSTTSKKGAYERELLGESHLERRVGESGNGLEIRGE